MAQQDEPEGCGLSMKHIADTKDVWHGDEEVPSTPRTPYMTVIHRGLSCLWRGVLGMALIALNSHLRTR